MRKFIGLLSLQKKETDKLKAFALRRELKKFFFVLSPHEN